MTASSLVPKTRILNARALYVIVVLSAGIGTASGLLSAAAIVWHPLIAGVPLAGWLLVIVGAATVTAAGECALHWVTRHLGPSRGGFATATAVDSELSRRAVRRIATWTRPVLVRRRRRPPARASGFSAHRYCGRRIWIPWEGSSATVGPEQSIPLALDPVAMSAPGALLVIDAKPNLVTRLTRRSDKPGPVRVCDLHGNSPAEAGVTAWRWSLLAGCADQTAARRRAEAMINATSIAIPPVPPGPLALIDDPSAGHELATAMLAGYLTAAERAGTTGISALLKWINARIPPPQHLLEDHLARSSGPCAGVTACGTGKPPGDGLRRQ